MRLEEIAQLVVGDIRDQQANGATITVIDIHTAARGKTCGLATPNQKPVTGFVWRFSHITFAVARRDTQHLS